MVSRLSPYRWIRSHPAPVAEALHEIADRLSERGLRTGRRPNRVEPRGEPHGGYSAESDVRCVCFPSALDFLL